MNLIIHRGTHDIGGSCVEIQSQNTRVIIDIGIPLTKDGKPFDFKQYKRLTGPQLVRKNILPCVKGLYKWDKESSPVNAILISHSHIDHYGFLPYVNPDIPVYTSEGCKELLGIAYYFGQCSYDPQNVKAVPPWDDFPIGDLSIKPYLVDHSAPDAFAYEITGDGEKIFYSGDFRGHGKKKTLFEHILKYPPRNIDILIMEGTTIEREEGESESEQDVEEKLVKVFNNKKQLIIFSCSHQNLDRLTVLYNACLRTGRTLVMIPYTAYILDKLKKLSKKTPRYDMSQIRVLFEESRYTKKVETDEILLRNLKKSEISFDDMIADKKNMVVLDSYLVRTELGKRGSLKKAILVYSLWEGYLKDAAQFWNDHNVYIKKVHTSGHASVKELKEFVKAINPGRIIPIHTPKPDKFREYFGSKVRVASDGELIKL